MKQLARRNDSLSKKVPILHVLISPQHELYFSFVVLSRIPWIRVNDADAPIEQKDPNDLWLVALGNTFVVGRAGVSLTHERASEAHDLIFKTWSRDQSKPWYRAQNANDDQDSPHAVKEGQASAMAAIEILSPGIFAGSFAP